MFLQHRLRQAADILMIGGVVAYPTESVFGLGCDPMNASAVARIIEIKGRNATAGFILLASDLSQLEPYLATGSGIASEVHESWPGPVSWVMPASSQTPQWITGNRDTVAVRVTAHPLAAALCSAYGGAIVSTSANRSGRSAARSALQVRRRFGTALDYVLPGSTGKRAMPSEIRDSRSGAVIRPGHNQESDRHGG
ncbi:MAG: L-threonylcarbamoyladenylate synthase [Gammaproteobacteria bacterium]